MGMKNEALRRDTGIPVRREARGSRDGGMTGREGRQLLGGGSVQLRGSDAGQMGRTERRDGRRLPGRQSADDTLARSLADYIAFPPPACLAVRAATHTSGPLAHTNTHASMLHLSFPHPLTPSRRRTLTLWDSKKTRLRLLGLITASDPAANDIPRRV